VEAIKQKSGEADRLGHATCDRSPGEAYRQQYSEDQGLCSRSRTLEDLVFGGWDIFEENCYEAAVNAAVLDRPLLDKLKEPLSALKPMPAVFDQEYVKRINGPNQKPKGSKMEHAEMLMDDIRQFKARTGASRLAMIWCGSTEVFHRAAAVHQNVETFEKGLADNDPEIFAQSDLRLRRDQIRRVLYEWRAPPDRGRSRAHADGAATTACRSRARITRPARRS